MAVQLDSDERARVEAARLTTRPKYFSASTGTEQTISEDFEAFLILQDAATISATLAWLSAAGLLATQQLDRDAIAFEANVAEQTDTADQLDEVTTTTTAFNAWRTAFRAGKFSDTPEVSLIIRDLQLLAEELFANEARLVHLQRIEQRTNNFLRQSITSAQLREMQSWPTPLLTY